MLLYQMHRLYFHHLLDRKLVFMVVNRMPCNVVSCVNSLKSNFHFEVSLISISSAFVGFYGTQMHFQD